MTDALHHQRIGEHLERGQLALFLGGDLPREVTGLPSRADLARGLALRHALDESLSLAQAAQRVARGGNRFDFTSTIRDQLDTTGLAPQPFHRRIVELVAEQGLRTLITTAYDDLLELALRDAGVPFNRVVRGSDVSFIDPNRPTLIRLYGDAQQPDTLVVTEDDHFGLWRDREKEDLLGEVRRALRRNAVLFLGYNLSDPDFNLLWREVLDRAGKFALGAFAVWPGLAEGDAAMWRDRGIRILDTDPFGITGAVAVQAAPPGRPDATLPPSAQRESPTWDTEAIRQLLTAAFSDGELTTLLFDRFHPVYENLGSGMGKGDKIQRLLDYCTRQDLLDELLDQVARRNPAQYARFEPQLRRVSPSAAAAPATLKGEGDAVSAKPILGTGNRWAVLVGVNEYEDEANYGRLQVCVKDVEAVRDQLVAGGFGPARIRLLTDRTDEAPARANVLVALQAVADATEPADLLLFYYSGHGDEAGGESYLVARDGRKLVLGDTAIPLARVREIVEAAPARAKIIVLDACHSGADIGGKGPRPMSAEFIRRVFEEAEGLAVLASCKQGQLSFEWRENERSVFTHFLLEGLVGAADRDEKGFVTVQDASRHVTNGVKLWASQRNVSQTPTLQYTVAGDIILVRVDAGGHRD